MGKRHIELSEKIFKLGTSLTKESNESEDNKIGILGKIMILLSGILGHEEDLLEFNLLCTMYSSKKFIEQIPDDVIVDIINKIRDTDIDNDLNDLLDDLI